MAVRIGGQEVEVTVAEIAAQPLPADYKEPRPLPWWITRCDPWDSIGGALLGGA